MADSLNMKVLVFCLFILFSHSISWANCLDNMLALDVQKATLFNENFKSSEQLMTTSQNGKYYSLIKLDSIYKKDQQVLSLYINFDIGSDRVALPYNLMGYEVLLNNEIVHKEDFTQNCQVQSPYTFMPGDYVELIKVKNITINNYSQNLQIKLWGQ